GCQRMGRLPEIADGHHRRVLGTGCDHPALHRRQIWTSPAVAGVIDRAVDGRIERWRISTGPSCPWRRRRPFACGDQSPETPVDKETPSIGTGVEAFELGAQTQVSESDFRLRTLRGDFERDFSAGPLARVLGEREMGVQYAPNDLLASDEFRDLLLGMVEVLVTIGELIPELVGATFYVS